MYTPAKQRIIVQKNVIISYYKLTKYDVNVLLNRYGVRILNFCSNFHKIERRPIASCKASVIIIAFTLESAFV